MPARPYSFHDKVLEVWKQFRPGQRVLVSRGSRRGRAGTIIERLDELWTGMARYAEWRKLHAPNRLTLKYRRADTGMGDRWWPVTLNNDRTMALFTHRADAATCAERADHRSVLDPIDVEVTVKP